MGKETNNQFYYVKVQLFYVLPLKNNSIIICITNTVIIIFGDIFGDYGLYSEYR